MRLPERRPNEIPSYTRAGLGVIPEAANPYPYNISTPANWMEGLPNAVGKGVSAYQGYRKKMSAVYATSMEAKLREKYLEFNQEAMEKFDPVDNLNFPQQVRGHIDERFKEWFNNPESGYDARETEVNAALQETLQKWQLADTDTRFTFAAVANQKYAEGEVNKRFEGTNAAVQMQFKQDLARGLGLYDSKVTPEELNAKGQFYNGVRWAAADASQQMHRENWKALQQGLISYDKFVQNQTKINHDSRFMSFQTMLDEATNAYNEGDYTRAIKIVQNIPGELEYISIVNRYDRHGNVSASPLWDEYLTDEYLANFEKNEEVKGVKDGLKVDIQRSNVLTAEEKRSILNKAEDIKKMSLQGLQKAAPTKQQTIILNPEVKHFNQLDTVKQIDHTWKNIQTPLTGREDEASRLFYKE